MTDQSRKYASFSVVAGGAAPAPAGPLPRRSAPSLSPEDVLRRVDLDILGGKLRALVDELATVLTHTALSPVINEVLDFACSVCDAEGRLIAQTNGITILTGTIGTQLAAVRRKFGPNIRSGDVFVTNDPDAGNTHVADITLMKPVFFDGEPVGFITVTAHCNELGGRVAGSLPPDAVDIFEEGLRIPPLRLVREGMLQQDIVDLIAGNVRLPEMTTADLMAQLAVVRLGDARLRDLCEVYGADSLRAGFDRALDTGEALCRAAIARLPNGDASACDWIDGDGVTGGRLPIAVKVTVAGNRVVADFSGSAAQRAAPINCTRAALESAVRTALMALVQPGAALNEGWFRPLTVLAPEGTVFTARLPAATGWGYEAGSHATDLVWKALAQIVPERLSAGNYTSLCVTYLGGPATADRPAFVLVEPHAGGWGATADADGANALIAPADGDTYNHSVELFEAKYPARVNRYALDTAAAAGAGEFRGGFGVVRDYEMLADGLFAYASMGRSVTPPWGLEGGEPGSTNHLVVEGKNGGSREARMPLRALHRGDRMTVVTGSGGGYGDPLRRAPDRVLTDVIDGYLDADAAREIYGVVLVPEAGGLRVDTEATAALRAAGGQPWVR